jgi:hypothetical protein
MAIRRCETVGENRAMFVSNSIRILARAVNGRRGAGRPANAVQRRSIVRRLVKTDPRAALSRFSTLRRCGRLALCARPQVGRRSKMATTRVSASARGQRVGGAAGSFLLGPDRRPRTPDGVSPKRRRNTRLKCDTSPKPAARAISMIARCRRRGSVSIANARSSRRSTRRSVTTVPSP